jgi:hypothetical protein
MTRSYRWLSPRNHTMIRGAIQAGESVTEVAKAYGITVSHASKIGLGKTKPRRLVATAAGAWKDYGPKCKRGHPRPAIRDRRARRCRQCQALRNRLYRTDAYKRLRERVEELEMLVMR